jgi:hypothetical protein
MHGKYFLKNSVFTEHAQILDFLIVSPLNNTMLNTSNIYVVLGITHNLEVTESTQADVHYVKIWYFCVRDWSLCIFLYRG